MTSARRLRLCSVSGILCALLVGLGTVQVGCTGLTADLTKQGSWENTTSIYISNLVPFRLTIDLPQNITTSNLTASIASSTGAAGENVFSFCSVVVKDTNLTSNVTLQYASGTPYEIETVTIDFGTVSTGPVDGDNQIVLEFGALVVNSVSFSSGQNYSVLASVLSDLGDWADLSEFTAQSPNLYSNVPPLFALLGDSDVIPGGLVNWTVNVNLMDAVSRVRIESSLNGSYDVAPCTMTLLTVGSYFHCFTGSATNFTVTGAKGILHADTIINAGFDENELGSENNTIVFKLLTRVPAYVLPSDVLNVNIDVYLDGKLAWEKSQPLNITTGTLSSPTTSPSLTVGKLVPVLEIAKGTSSVFTVDIFTPPTSVVDYRVEANINPGKASISDIRVISGGESVCLDDTGPRSYASTGNDSFNDEAIFELGSVVNTAETGATVHNSNLARIEVVVCLPLKAMAAIGDTLLFKVKVIYDGVTLQDSIGVTVTALPDTTEVNGAVSFSQSGMNGTGYIADIVSLDLELAMAETKDKFVMDVNVPVDGGFPAATVMEAAISFMGRNIGCQGYKTITALPLAASSIDLGYITHTGTFDRYQYGVEDPSDDTVTVSIQLRVEDRPLNVQGYRIPVSVSITGDGGATASTLRHVLVQVTGIEAPLLEATFWIEPFHYSAKSSGDSVTFYGHLNQTASTTGYAHNVTAHVRLPYYVTFGNMVYVNGTNLTVESKSPEPGVELKFPVQDFDLDVKFAFDVLLDVNRAFPAGHENVKTVVPIDVTYDVDKRSDRVNPGTLYTDITVLSFGFNTDQPLKLGMKSGTILDCQLAASSSLPGNEATEARLDAGLGWKPHVRGEPFCGNEFLQISLGNLTEVVSLDVQSSVDSLADIPSGFQLRYSSDGVAWFLVGATGMSDAKTFTIDTTAGSSVSDVYTISLGETERFRARYVRVLPQSATCTFGLRLELYGNSLSADVADGCVSVQFEQPRSYVVNPKTGTIFVCSDSDQGDVLCSMSDDEGSTWMPIDASVQRVVGVIDDSPVVHGLASDGATNLVSLDDGFSWVLVTSGEAADLQADPGYTARLTLPYLDTRGEGMETTFSSYGVSSHTFRLTGDTGGVHVDGSAGGWTEAAWWGTRDWNSV